jgi:hypothetical protein
VPVALSSSGTCVRKCQEQEIPSVVMILFRCFCASRGGKNRRATTIRWRLCTQAPLFQLVLRHFFRISWFCWFRLGYDRCHFRYLDCTCLYTVPCLSETAFHSPSFLNWEMYVGQLFFLGPSIVVWGNGANSLVQHHTVTHLHLTKDYADLPLSNYVPVVLSSEYRSSQWTAAERMLSVTIEEPSES